MTELIGRYALVRPLIASRFCRLFLADDLELGRQAVVKVFAVNPDKPPKPFTFAQWQSRFAAEARILAGIDHPNLMPVWDWGVTMDSDQLRSSDHSNLILRRAKPRLEGRGSSQGPWPASSFETRPVAAPQDEATPPLRSQSNGTPYLVMPFMPCNLPTLMGFDFYDDDDLSKVRPAERPRALPWPLAAGLFAQVLAGLAHLHERGIIHRDVKAANVLMTARDGTARLGDLGMAKRGRQDGSRGGIWIGTKDYIAPEQYRDASTVSDRADVYSAGVLAYRMLTGRLALGAFAPPGALADMPKAFDALVMDCLAPSAAKRPSAAEAAGRLAAILHGPGRVVGRTIRLKVGEA